MHRMLNKKGVGEGLISIWWFFVLAIVGIVVSAAVVAYHSVDIDVREIEAENLYERILNCVAKQSFLLDEALEEDFNIFEECRLNEEIFGEGSVFYFNIRFLMNLVIR